MRGGMNLKNKGLVRLRRCAPSLPFDNSEHGVPPFADTPTVAAPDGGRDCAAATASKPALRQQSAALAADAALMPCLWKHVIDWSRALGFASTLACGVPRTTAAGHCCLAAADPGCPAPEARRAVRSSAFRGAQKGEKSAQALYWGRSRAFCL